MPVLDITIATVGLVALCLSLVLYWRRNHDLAISSRLWLARARLTRSEYVLNRIGFAIAVAGTIRIWTDVATMVFYHR